jgi:hypothetical protein
MTPPRRAVGRARLPAVIGALALGLGLASGAAAADATPDQMARIEAQLAEQARRLADQDRRLQEQQSKIDSLEAEREEFLAAIRAAGIGPIASRGIRTVAPIDQVPHAVTELPAGPVGEKPQTAPLPEVTAIPAAMNVLTPKGRLILDPSIEYVRTSNNRLVFRGVEIVPGVQLGVIEASDVARDTAVATLAGRFGVTSRLEVEARLPWVYRHDRFSLLAQTTPDFEGLERELHEDGIGDVELAARYQINSGRGGRPIFVASTRVKPPTGISPYEVAFDKNGVALGLATGSGFWSLEGGLTMIYPSEPAIIFGGLTYLHNFSRDIDRQIGPALVGHVDPGDSIGAQVGFGLSLNPRFSVSFGYSHNYIFRTISEIGTTRQKSRSLEVGSLLMGWSFRLSNRVTLNNSFEFGVTSDAPDMRVVLRAPYRF